MLTIVQGIMPLVLVHTTSCLDGNHICQLIYSLGQTLLISKVIVYTYIENLKKQMEWEYQTANEAIKKEQDRNKQRYDCKVRCVKLMIGDKVLLRHTAFKGKHKIQDQWENTAYEVTEQPLGK